MKGACKRKVCTSWAFRQEKWVQLAFNFLPIKSHGLVLCTVKERCFRIFTQCAEKKRVAINRASAAGHAPRAPPRFESRWMKPAQKSNKQVTVKLLLIENNNKKNQPSTM